MIAFPRSLQPASREQPVRDQASDRGERVRLVQLLDGWMDGTEGGGGRGVYTTSAPTVPGVSGSGQRKRCSLISCRI